MSEFPTTIYPYSRNDVSELMFTRVMDGVWWRFKDRRPLVEVSYEMEDKIKGYIHLGLPLERAYEVPTRDVVIYRRTDL